MVVNYVNREDWLERGLLLHKLIFVIEIESIPNQQLEKLMMMSQTIHTGQRSSSTSKGIYLRFGMLGINTPIFEELVTLRVLDERLSQFLLIHDGNLRALI